MSCQINLFAELEIEAEFPENSYSITLQERGTKTSITMYLDLSQWWNLRTVFPRAKSYTLHRLGISEALQGEMADDWALQFFEGRRAVLPIPEPAPITPAPALELDNMPF